MTEKLEKEISLLKEKKECLDQRLEKEKSELEELKSKALEVKVRRIVLEELLKKY